MAVTLDFHVARVEDMAMIVEGFLRPGTRPEEKTSQSGVQHDREASARDLDVMEDRLTRDHELPGGPPPWPRVFPGL